MGNTIILIDLKSSGIVPTYKIHAHAVLTGVVLSLSPSTDFKNLCPNDSWLLSFESAIKLMK